MYDPAAKRRQRIRLTFTYAVMVLITLSLVVVAVFFAQGYRYNGYEGKIKQGGMIQFDSAPNGASVQLDAVKLANRTATRITATSGEHTITISRDGYASWRKKVVVKPGSVLWLNYIRLMPNDPQTATASTFSAVSDALASPNHELFAMIPNAQQPTITFLKVNNSSIDQNSVTLANEDFTPPAEGQTQAFSLLAWDDDSKRVTVKHTYDGDKTEYIVVETDNSVKNITTQFGVSVADFYYDPTDYQVAYVLTKSNEIRRLNLSSNTLSGPLVTNASSLTVAYNGWVGYATLPNKDGVRTVGYISKGKTTPKAVQTFSDMADKSLSYTIGRYHNETYQIVTADDGATIFKDNLPASDSKDELSAETIAKLPLSKKVIYAGFSPEEQRFVYLQNGQDIVTYDLELASMAIVKPSVPLKSEVAWLDKYHLLSVADGVVEFSDYDGTNTHIVARDAAVSGALVSADDRYFYYFAQQSDSSVQLVRMTMATN